MSYIMKFISNSGELLFGDGKDENFRISEIRGLGFPDVERQTVVYSGRRGEKTLSKRFLPRVITIKLDVMKSKLMSYLVKALSEDGELYIKADDKERHISAICVAMDEIEKIGDITRLVLQFIADDPAFLEFPLVRQGIFERVDLVSGSLSLPCVFTRRVCGGSFYNNGDLTTEPILTILCISSAGNESSLKLNNNTTGAKIELTYKFKAGDVITIDTKNAEIYNQNGESLLPYISDDTYLSEFVLSKGENEISVTSSLLTNDLQVICEYNKKYLEMIL